MAKSKKSEKTLKNSVATLDLRNAEKQAKLAELYQANKLESDSAKTRVSLDKAWQDVQNMLKSVIFNGYTVDNVNRPVWLSFYVVSFDSNQWQDVFMNRPVIATLRLVEFTRDYTENSGKRESFYVGRVLVNPDSNRIIPYVGFKLELKESAIRATRKAHKHSTKYHVQWSDMKAQKWNAMLNHMLGESASKLLESESAILNEAQESAQ